MRTVEFRPRSAHDAGFLRDRRGSAAIEVALMIALGVGALFLGLSALGDNTQRKFGDLAVTLGQPGAVPAAAPKDNAAPQPPHPYNPDCPHCAPTTAQTLLAWQYEILTSILAGGAILLGVLIYRRRGLQPTTDQQKRQAAERVQLPEGLFTKRQALLRLLNDNLAAVLETHLQVRHIMSQRLATVSPDTPLDEVHQLMKAKRIRHLLVCDGPKLVGIISDRDVKARDGRKAADIMTRDPASVTPDTAASPAVTILINKSISCLPVVENGSVAGILTTTDIMLALQCTMQLLERVGQELRTSPAGGEAHADAEAEARESLVEVAAG